MAGRAVNTDQFPPKALTGTALREWMALRRVGEGAVTKLGTHWLDHGRPVPCFLPDTLNDLTHTGLITLTDPDPLLGGRHRATITPAGHTHYRQLCAEH
ncbi:MAG: hypothetical protein ACRDTC_15370 [Pseudonocardiaceae bacterium]